MYGARLGSIGPGTGGTKYEICEERAADSLSEAPGHRFRNVPPSSNCTGRRAAGVRSGSLNRIPPQRKRARFGHNQIQKHGKYNKISG